MRDSFGSIGTPWRSLYMSQPSRSSGVGAAGVSLRKPDRGEGDGALVTGGASDSALSVGMDAPGVAVVVLGVVAAATGSLCARANEATVSANSTNAAPNHASGCALATRVPGRDLSRCRMGVGCVPSLKAMRFNPLTAFRGVRNVPRVHTLIS